MKKIEVTNVTFISIFFVFVGFSSAGGDWTYYMDGNYINEFTIQGDYIYCATKSGLVIWNRHDKTYENKRYYSSEMCCMYQSNNFTTVAVDTYGTVWCGNLDREIYLFDGTGWTVYTHEDSGLERKAESLHTDNNNVLWVSTDEGIVCFDGTTWTDYDKNDSGDVLVKVLGIDRNNVMWFRTNDGVTSFDGTIWGNYTVENGLPSGSVYEMAVGTDNTKWFSHGSMISRFDGSSWTAIEIEGAEYSATIIEVDDNDTVWCGSRNNGIYRYDGSSWKTYTSDNSGLSADTINALITDDEGVLWISHNNNLSHGGIGLSRFNGINWSNWLIDGPLSYSINSVAVDKNNTIWFGTGFKGLSSFDGTLWHSYTMADTVRIMDISCLAVDNNNMLWMDYSTKYEHPEGSSKDWFVSGILSYDGTVWKKYPHELTGMPYGTTETAVDHDNVKWFSFGTSANGISRFDDYTWEYFPRDGLGNKFGRPIAVDHNNIKWFGSEGGITSFDGINWEHYVLPGDARTRYMDIDHNNVKWILSDYYGVYSLEGSQLDYHGLSEFIVNLESGHEVVLTDEIVVDSRGVKWFIATEYDRFLAGVGLLSFDGETWRYHRDDFWFTNSTSRLTIDHNDVKWLSGGKGIARYDGDANGGGSTEVLKSDRIPENSIPNVNYPNPFNHSTTITFILEQTGFTTLAIYNSSGQKVRELLAEQRPAGAQSILWDGHDDNGLPVSSGIYLAGITQGKRAAINRMVVIK